MLGGMEVSAEYILLWRIVKKCEGCSRYRELAVKGVEVQMAVHGDVIRIKRRRVGEAAPCIVNCKRLSDEEKADYDLLRFQELRETYEPVVIDYSEDNARERACMRFELNSFL